MYKNLIYKNIQYKTMYNKKYFFATGMVLAWMLFLASMPIQANQTRKLTAPPPQGYQHADSLDSLLHEANEAYRNNNLEKALKGYLYLTQLNIKNGYLAYNLGNTYFRLGQLGPAMLWYERALNYIPRNQDLRVNFKYARNQIVDEEFKPPEPTGTVAFFTAMHNYLNMQESLYMTLLMLWLLVISLTVYIWIDSDKWKARLRIPCWITGVLFIILFLSSGIKIYHHENITEAIVMSSAVNVKTAPSEKFSTAFTLHEGTKVIVEQSKDNWVRIKLPGNEAFTGWMPKESVVTI